MKNKSGSFKERIRANSKLNLLDDTTIESSISLICIRVPKTEIYSSSQVRKFFDVERIREMGNSLVEHGQIQPIVVYPKDDQGYKIQKGERRWRGAMSNDNVKFLDCIIRVKGTVFEQLAENIIREALTPFETGRAIIQAKKEKGLDNKQISLKLTISEARVSAFIKAASCPLQIEVAYKEGKIGDVDTINSLRIAYNINKRLVNEALENSISRKEAKALVKSLKINHKVKLVKKARSVRIKYNDHLGYIDLKGESKDGFIDIILDNNSEKVIVPVSDIHVVGYFEFCMQN
ncbi:ParB/RepB/Spo0J family partition protein [Candidatus Enterovibrio escicola]|nr:ParB/RepB/Spo0J family partition protein [Candidatus Enterovibrio escacola]